MNSHRFAISLDLINRHYQEPNRNRYESRYFWEELYPLISASGFRSIEIPYEPVWQFGGRSGVPMNRYCINTKYGTAGRYRERLKNSGIDRVAGLTFDPNLFMRNDNLAFFFGASGHFAGEALTHAADLGAGYLAISPSAYYGRTAHYHPDIEAKLSTFAERATDWLQGLATKAEGVGVTLVLRQDYWSLFRGERYFSLLDALPASVKLDVDAAHLTIAGLDPLALIAEQSGRIGSVHLTDTAFVDTDQTWKSANPEFPEHRATQIFRDPGTGDVKLGEIVSQLERLNYQGPLVWSARQTRDPFRALLRTRAFLNQLTH